MTDPISLRRYVREVLALRPRDEFTERLLFDAVERLAGRGLEVDELRAAIEWNHARNLIEFRHHEEIEQDVWRLTDAGKAKEGVK